MRMLKYQHSRNQIVAAQQLLLFVLRFGRFRHFDPKDVALTIWSFERAPCWLPSKTCGHCKVHVEVGTWQSFGNCDDYCKKQSPTWVVTVLTVVSWICDALFAQKSWKPQRIQAVDWDASVSDFKPRPPSEAMMSNVYCT